MTIKVNEIEFEEHPAGLGGKIARVDFENGYTASIIHGGPFYTVDGTYEIAVIHSGRIVYNTPITDDVLGYLSEDEANEALQAIAALPKRVVPFNGEVE